MYHNYKCLTFFLSLYDYFFLGIDFKDAAAEALKGLDDFMKTRSDRYRVDCHYTDFFG